MPDAPAPPDDDAAPLKPVTKPKSHTTNGRETLYPANRGIQSKVGTSRTQRIKPVRSLRASNPNARRRTKNNSNNMNIQAILRKRGRTRRANGQRGVLNFNVK